LLVGEGKFRLTLTAALPPRLGKISHVKSVVGKGKNHPEERPFSWALQRKSAQADYAESQLERIAWLTEVHPNQ